MREKVGEIFSIPRENPPLENCTISKTIQAGKTPVTYFSLAKDTDISKEFYPYHKFLLVLDGQLDVYEEKEQISLHKGQGMCTKIGIPLGMGTQQGTVYLEVLIEKEARMHKIMKEGEVFKLADLLPYQEGKIVNMDLFHNEKTKFVLMSFAEGTSLPEHGAPGDALIFALDGQATIGYEGEEHQIKAGENFHFAKAGRHWIKAEKAFKMALLLTLEDEGEDR